MGHTKVHKEMVYSGKNLTDLHKTQSGTLFEQLWYEFEKQAFTQKQCLTSLMFFEHVVLYLLMKT